MWKTLTCRVGLIVVLAYLPACDGREGAADAAPAVDAAPSTQAPPAPLSGLFHLRIERTGGDCPAALPGAQTVDLDEAGGRLVFERRGVVFEGTRQGNAVAVRGAGATEWAGCAVQEDTTWEGTIRAPGNAFTLKGTSTLAPSGPCAFSACTAEWTGRGARVGGHGPSGFSPLALHPTDTAVEATADFGGAAWFATANSAGGRIWRLINDVGVPSLTSVIGDGFRSENSGLAGNNQSVRSLAVAQGLLYAGTLDALDGDPPGNGFDLWAFDGTTWRAEITDGLGERSREAVDSLAVLDDVLYLGVRNRAGVEVWRRSAAGAFSTVYPVPGAEDAAHAAGPQDPRRCATEVTSMAVHAGRLHVALGGAACEAGAFVLRLDDPQIPQWTLISEGGFGDPAWREASLASAGLDLFAVARGPTAALFRHVGGRQWVLHATDGFGHPGARGAARAIAPPARDFVFFALDGDDGGSVWATQGGADPRDLLRVGKGAPLHPGTHLGPAFVFEERLFVGTVGTPATLLRSNTRLAEQGAGTIRTAHDAVETASRGAGTACHDAAFFFNPALQADQALRVVLPPGVKPNDNVLLPSIYILPPALNAPLATADGPDARRPRMQAWLDAAQASHGALVACLFGRRSTVPCEGAESDAQCLQRCLAERVPTLLETDGLYGNGPPMGVEAAGAVMASLGEITLPVIERFALVLVDLGAGFAVDAPDEARWFPQVPARDEEGVLWSGELGAYASALEAAADELERCWPASIRPDPSARYLLGHGRGGFSAVQALLRRSDVFNGAVAVDATFSLDRLVEDAAGRAIIASINEPFRGLMNGSLAPLYLVVTPDQGCATCETAAFCTAMAEAQQVGQAFASDLADPVQALVPALQAITALQRGTRPPPITCGDLPAGDCQTCGNMP